jgi:betaine lipid synthase
MASPGGNISPPESIISPQIFVAGLAGVVFFTIGFYQLSSKPPQDGADDEPSFIKSILLFCYSCFLKPHSHGAKGSQQGALESFYAGQAAAVRLSDPPRKDHASLTSRAVRCD